MGIRFTGGCWCLECKQHWWWHYKSIVRSWRTLTLQSFVLVVGINLCFVTLVGWCSTVTCLCQGVRMNDSSSSIRVFLSISSVKSTITLIFDTLGDRVTTCSEVSEVLSHILGPESHYIERFFVALLKFPPIVQSGSILFRKLDRERAGPWREPLPLRGVIGWGAHVWPMTSPSCREWQKILQLFNL